jgi:hypothetical protein
MDLLAALASADVEERSRAAEELSRLGTEAQPAALALVRACGDEAEEVREWAVAALEELGPPPATDVPALTALLDDASADVAYWTATLLGRLAAEAAPAVSALATALASSPYPAVRQRAAWALGAIGPAASKARLALNQAAASDDPRLADLAQAAISRIVGP